MVYMILDDMEGLFKIDSVDGFIYANRDYGLEPRTYTLTVIYLFLILKYSYYLLKFSKLKGTSNRSNRRSLVDNFCFHSGHV